MYFYVDKVIYYTLIVQRALSYTRYPATLFCQRSVTRKSSRSTAECRPSSTASLVRLKRKNMQNSTVYSRMAWEQMVCAVVWQTNLEDGGKESRHRSTQRQASRLPWAQQGTLRLYAPPAPRRCTSSVGRVGRARRVDGGRCYRMTLTLTTTTTITQTVLKGPCSRSQARKTQHPPEHFAHPDRGRREQGRCTVLSRKGSSGNIIKFVPN